jgi:hypothetical protein
MAKAVGRKYGIARERPAREADMTYAFHAR